MKTLVLAWLIALSFNSQAAITDSEILSAVTCNTLVVNNYWISELTKKYGPPARTAQGAMWFTASGTVYGAQLKEVFVSSTNRWTFMGIVLEGSPESLLPTIKASRLYPTNTFPSNGHWIGSDGRTIMWHEGKDTKMFCTATFN